MATQIPEWQKIIVSNLQKVKDEEYAAALAKFKLASAEWIESAKRARLIGTVAPQFSGTIPVRYLVGVSDDGQQYTETPLPADPNIHLPVLPPEEPTLPPVVISSGAGLRDDAMFGMLSQILVNQSKIMKKLEV